MIDTNDHPTMKPLKIIEIPKLKGKRERKKKMMISKKPFRAEKQAQAALEH